MAASYGHPIGRASVGAGGSWLEQQLPLPSGACGYRDLSAGGAAPTCGCRRFWLATGVQQGGERAWCFCGHHACFHESAVIPQIYNVQTMDGGHNTVQASAQGPVGGSIAAQQFAVEPTWSQLIGDNSRNERGAARPSGSVAGLGIRNTSQVPSQSINTRLWHALNGFAREQDNGGNSGDTSKLPSTAVPSVVDEPRSPMRASSNQNQGLHLMGPPPSNIPPSLTNEIRTDQYSATEVATPSVRGTPVFSAFAGPPPQATTSRTYAHRGQSPQNAAEHGTLRRAQSLENSLPGLRPPSAGPSLSIQEMCNTIQNYGRRIDILETISFTHLPSDEVIDRFDMVDGRLLDIEHWRTEQDRAQEADDVDERIDEVKTRLDELEHWRDTESARPSHTPGSMRHLLPDSSSFASDGSFDSEAAAQTEAIVLATLAANAETRPRIDALESRIMDLEHATMPSFARPWTVQVVLLPFGRQLPGIWFSSSESTQHSQRTQASQEWSGLVPPRSTAKSSFTSNADTGAWTTESIEAWARRTEDDWLSAKACGPSGAVFQRLESRGLVRDIILTSSDARHVCNELRNAFGNVLGDAAACEGSDRFQGLQERFIPLRKVRKSSRLRFLGTAEMISSAAWNAALLDSSVFMKVNDGERRLYVTTPEAYTQPLRCGWSWQSIRNLPMYGADGELQAAQIVGRVKEKCWTFSDRLDHASSLHSSFASQESLWGMSSKHSSDHREDPEDSASHPTSQQNTARSDPRQNTSPAQAMEIDGGPKRRVASFEIESAVAGKDHAHAYMSKRRRVSSSPELERRGVNFTPRWSREPPSPFPSDDVGIARSQAASNRARGTTPFAYATPHSNLDSRGDDGDTEVDTEPRLAQSENGEYSEEWEGMQEYRGEDQMRSCGEEEDLAGHDLFDEDDELSLFVDDEV